MTLAQIKTILKETGVPVVYGFFTGPIKPPYISYREAYTNNAFADNVVLTEILHIDVELVTEKKDMALEKRLKDALTSHKIAWQKSGEGTNEKDGTFSIIYEFEEVANG